MSKAPEDKTTVAAIAVSEETRNRIAALFSQENSRYELGDESVADVSIVDLDGYLLDMVRRDHEARYPGRPLVVLSDKLIDGEDQTVVHKPQQADELVKALDALVTVAPADQPEAASLDQSADTAELEQPLDLELLTESQDDPTIIQLYKSPLTPSPDKDVEVRAAEPPPSPEEPVVPPPKPVGAEQENKMDLLQYLFSGGEQQRANEDQEVGAESESVPPQKVASTVEKRPRSTKVPDHLLVGRRENVDLNDERQLGRIFFSPSDHLLGCIMRVVEYADMSGSAVRVEGLPKPVVYYPANRLVLSGWTDRELFTFAQTNLDKEKVIIKVLTSEEPRSAAAVARLKPVEPFIWKLALWTSMGRLPVGTSLDKVVVQKHWPNLTRLPRPPYAGALSVLWEKGNFSILDVLEVLSIPQRYVFGYYSGVYALGLVSLLDTPKKKTTDLSESPSHSSLVQHSQAS